MNDTELREKFDQWAAPLRAIPAPDFARLRSQARRRNAGLAGLAACFLAVTGLLAGLIAASVTSTPAPSWPAVWGSGSFPAPPGQPYVVVSTGDGPAVLRNAATGAVLEVLQPGGGQFLAVTATPGDRLFVLAQASASGQLAFAELRIGTQRLVPVLPGAALPDGSQISSMAVNAAGTRLAVAFSTPGGSNAGLGTMQVYNLQTGTLIGSWQAQAANLSAPQFLGTGNTLVVDWPTSFTASRILSDLRLMDTTAAFPARSSLLADSRSGGARRGTPGTLSQDGSVTMATVNGQAGRASTTGGGSADLLEFDAFSGRLVARIPLGPAAAANGPGFCGVLWASANGRDLLTQCGSRQLAITGGKAVRVRLAWTFQASLSLQTPPFAW